MKIFGIGLSRTGTKSLTKALNMLGYSVNHFPRDKRTMDDVYNYLDTGECNLRVAEKFDAVIDMVPALMWRELAEKYPDAKFILTVRKPEEWIVSMTSLWDRILNRICNPPISDIEYSIGNFIAEAHNKIYGIKHFDPEIYLKKFKAHNKEVYRKFYASENFLLMDICNGDGWKGLCRFLFQEIPIEVPFPHIKNLGDKNNNYEYKHVMN